ncbi:MAG: hypothetical protein VZQ45_06335, partial [Ruminococcus sp.]|nr:hypothetical protein [Ruminococcus sp.]
MRKCKQVISLILALSLLFTMMSVGIVQTAAADDVVIYTDPPSQPALLGDVNRDGRVNMQDVYVLRSSVANKTGYLKYKDYGENTIEFKVADVFKDYEVGLKETIDLKDVYLLRSWIAHREEAQGKGIGEPVDTTATITIYGLNGQSETRKFNKGDSFDVYTSLNVKKSGEDVQIAAASGEQTFTDSVLTLSSAIDDDQLFTDTDTVFPVFGDKAMGRLRDAGLVQYNASTPGINNGFVFDSDDDLVIVTRYTVTNGGTGEVRNALSYLAAADDNLTKLVNDGVVDPEASLTVNATFDKPGSAPTEAPTDAPVPTEAPTDAPVPTEAPTDAPTPTEAPTDAPVPTEAPTDAPTPGDKLTVTVVSLDGVEDTKTF